MFQFQIHDIVELNSTVLNYQKNNYEELKGKIQRVFYDRDVHLLQSDDRFLLKYPVQRGTSKYGSPQFSTYFVGIDDAERLILQGKKVEI